MIEFIAPYIGGLLALWIVAFLWSLLPDTQMHWWTIPALATSICFVILGTVLGGVAADAAARKRRQRK